MNLLAKIKMKHLTLFVLLLIAFSSCETMKDYALSDKTKKESVTEVVETTKKGGKTVLKIPNIRYRDTTIYNVNRETKTILSTIYDKKGNQRIECLEAEVNEKFTRIEEMLQNDVETKDTRKSSFNPQFLIYAIGGLGIVIILIMVVLSYLMIRIQKQLPIMLASIINKQ